jgi:hypothetical protein
MQLIEFTQCFGMAKANVEAKSAKNRKATRAMITQVPMSTGMLASQSLNKIVTSLPKGMSMSLMVTPSR